MSTDEWGTPLAGAPDSVDAWNRAWRQFLAFTGDPLATLESANGLDDGFVLGPVFVATYLVLGASRLDAPPVREAMATGARTCGRHRSRIRPRRGPRSSGRR